jgi:hypothetical protein
MTGESWIGKKDVEERGSEITGGIIRGFAGRD